MRGLNRPLPLALQRFRSRPFRSSRFRFSAFQIFGTKSRVIFGGDSRNHCQRICLTVTPETAAVRSLPPPPLVPLAPCVAPAALHRTVVQPQGRPTWEVRPRSSPTESPSCLLDDFSDAPSTPAKNESASGDAGTNAIKRLRLARRPQDYQPLSA